MISGLPAQVKIVEVGPRDGLQNEKSHICLLYTSPSPRD